MAPALPHSEYASRASFGRRLALDLFEQPAGFVHSAAHEAADEIGAWYKDDESGPRR